MAYVRSSLGALTHEQTGALTSVSPEDIQALPVETRVSLALQHTELEVRRKEAFWNAVQGFAMGALPIFGFLGVRKLFK